MKKTNSVAVVEYKGTTKEIFEVGCTYKGIKVIARNGNQLTIQHLTPYIYHREGDIENKRVYLAGGEDTNFTEYIKWNYGIEICAHQKVEEEKEEMETKNMKELKEKINWDYFVTLMEQWNDYTPDEKHREWWEGQTKEEQYEILFDGWTEEMIRWAYENYDL